MLNKNQNDCIKASVSLDIKRNTNFSSLPQTSPPPFSFSLFLQEAGTTQKTWWTRQATQTIPVETGWILYFPTNPQPLPLGGLAALKALASLSLLSLPKQESYCSPTLSYPKLCLHAIIFDSEAQRSVFENRMNVQERKTFFSICSLFFGGSNNCNDVSKTGSQRKKTNFLIMGTSKIPGSNTGSWCLYAILN